MDKPPKSALKLAILGCRGIPNRYGGFEQFAEKLSAGLVQRGVEVWVYNAHNHPCPGTEWNGVKRIFCFDPEYLLGTPGQFIYDWNCISDSRGRGFDIILQLGTTSSSIWHWRLPKGPNIVTNMDGLEWKRSKYSRPVRRFLKYAERLAVRHSDCLVADSEAIRQYLTDEYAASSSFISYGAEIVHQPDVPEKLIPSLTSAGNPSHPVHLEASRFFLLIARLQPDNHIEEVIGGVLASGTSFPLVVIGNHKTKYGGFLKRKYRQQKIVFAGSVYDQPLLNVLRRHARIYFHGHSAGGTNPSLLEAMAARARICAHDNLFNRSVLGDDAHYFEGTRQIASLISREPDPEQEKAMIAGNLDKIRNVYSWDRIIDSYESLFSRLIEKKNSF